MYRNLCINLKYYTAITTNARNHLENKHQIFVGIKELKNKKARQ